MTGKVIYVSDSGKMLIDILGYLNSMDDRPEAGKTYSFYLEEVKPDPPEEFNTGLPASKET